MSDLELRVENLNVGFGRRTVLRDISFTVHAGEFICLLGQNAAGKTTLFKAVSNLIASSGRVTLCENGKALPRSAIAYLPQLTQVQSRLTVFEMVMLGLGRRLSWRVTPDIFERVDQTLHAMQISHLADRPVASLSGGYGQFHFYRIVQNGACQVLNLPGHRGRKHDGLPFFGQILDNLHDVVAEPHVQHTVRLIQYKERHFRQIHVA